MCIKLVALRMNLYQEVALSLNKVGDPWPKPYLTYDVTHTKPGIQNQNFFSLQTLRLASLLSVWTAL